MLKRGREYTLDEFQLAEIQDRYIQRRFESFDEYYTKNKLVNITRYGLYEDLCYERLMYDDYEE